MSSRLTNLQIALGAGVAATDDGNNHMCLNNIDGNKPSVATL